MWPRACASPGFSIRLPPHADAWSVARSARMSRCPAFPPDYLSLLALLRQAHALRDTLTGASISEHQRLGPFLDSRVSISDAQGARPQADGCHDPSRNAEATPGQVRRSRVPGLPSPHAPERRRPAISSARGLPLRIAAKVDKATVSISPEEIQPFSTARRQYIGRSARRERPSERRLALCSRNWPEPFGLVMIKPWRAAPPSSHTAEIVPEVLEDAYRLSSTTRVGGRRHRGLSSLSRAKIRGRDSRRASRSPIVRNT